MTVYVVGGPAGTGKTTIGEALAVMLKCPFVEGDALHPQANIDKMASGKPLTDDDRWGWLELVSKTAAEVAETKGNSVVLCSMLKRKYRDLISSTLPQVGFEFIFLYTTYAELEKRVAGRSGHFMKSDMVKSQYEIMEVPDHEQEPHGWPIDTTNKLPELILEEIANKVVPTTA